MSDKHPSDNPADIRQAQKAKRLAEALRSNLRRRKSAADAAKVPAADTDDQP